jgi:hypothetical protein
VILVGIMGWMMILIYEMLLIYEMYVMYYYHEYVCDAGPKSSSSAGVAQV